MTTADYEKRQADFTKREDAKTVKLGEFRVRVTGTIRKNDDVRVRIDKVEALSFKSSLDIKSGETLRITIEKI
jgi:hypothetical protein